LKTENYYTNPKKFGRTLVAHRPRQQFHETYNMEMKDEIYRLAGGVWEAEGAVGIQAVVVNAPSPLVHKSLL
jgi:hypothetical protein